MGIAKYAFFPLLKFVAQRTNILVSRKVAFELTTHLSFVSETI